MRKETLDVDILITSRNGVKKLYIKITAAGSTSPEMTTVFHARTNVTFLEIQSNPRRKKLYGTNQGSNFLGSSFNNRDNVRASIQFRRKRQPQHFLWDPLHTRLKSHFKAWSYKKKKHRKINSDRKYL